MTCREIQRMLSAAADGEVEGALAASVAEHVAGCAACAAARDHLAVIGGFLNDALSTTAVSGMEFAVMPRLPRWLVAVRRWKTPVPRWRGWAPISLMAFVVLWGMTQLSAVSVEMEMMATRYRLEQVTHALNGFRLASRRLPERLESLQAAAKNPRVSRQVRRLCAGVPLKDGWGRPWGYVVGRQSGKFFLYSYGKNGTDDRGDDDDIFIGI